MDGVKPIQKWTDGAGVLYDSEDEAVQGEARRKVRLIIGDAVNWGTRSVDVDSLLERRTAFIDALKKIERPTA